MKVNESIFKAYDIRGTYPDQLNEDIAVGVAKAFVSILSPKSVIVGRDARTSGPSIHKSLVATLIDHGVEVVDVGLVSSDMYYYACAQKKLPGIMITASHNPKEYNGFKMVRQIPYFFTGDDEIARIKEMIVNENFPGISTESKGSVTEWLIMDDFVNYMFNLVDASNFKKFKIVADTANGMVGPTIEKMMDRLKSLEIIPMYFEPDGTFPNHGGDPLEEENRHDIEKRIKLENADFGIMTDPDGDRFFAIDSKGRFIPGDFLTAIMSEYFLDRDPGAKIVYDIRASKVVPETIKKLGGIPLYNRVGHSYIKRRMTDEGAVFGGEVSGHYYFTDFFKCDSAILTFLFLLDYLSKKNKNLTSIIDEMEQTYFISGEINSEVSSVPDKLKVLEDAYKNSANEILHVDGISAEFDTWRFNVRGSNTQPLIRLNLEADTKELMEQKQKEVLEIIRS